MFFLSYYFFFFNCFFFFNDTATTEIYTLSLHDALPIYHHGPQRWRRGHTAAAHDDRSEEHASELQSHSDLVCRLLLEKKKNIKNSFPNQRKNNKLNNNIITTTI